MESKVQGECGEFDFGLKKIRCKTPTMKTPELEKRVVRLINPMENCIVPNVSWGLGLRHECDLLSLDKQHRFTEIELKVSRSDLQADFKKGHGHQSQIISRLVYAVPEELREIALELVPKECGIIVAYNDEYKPAEWLRTCKHNQNRPSEKIVTKFYRLGLIRLWTR